MLVKTIKPEGSLTLSNGITIKNVGSFNAKLGLTMPPEIRITASERGISGPEREQARLAKQQQQKRPQKELSPIEQDQLWEKAARSVSRL